MPVEQDMSNYTVSSYPQRIHLLLCTQRLKMHKVQRPGGHLNKKDGLSRYGDSHVKDKTS